MCDGRALYFYYPHRLAQGAVSYSFECGVGCECSVKWCPRVYIIGPRGGGIGVSDDALVSCSRGSTALSTVGEC